MKNVERTDALQFETEIELTTTTSKESIVSDKSIVFEDQSVENKYTNQINQ